MNILINGRFLSQKITGVQRYAIEITKKIDSLVDYWGNFQFSIVIPDGVDIENLKFKNIKIVGLKGKPGYFWEQIKLPHFVKKNKYDYLLSLCNLAPVLLKKKNVVCIHDMAVRTHPEFYSKKFVCVYKYIFKKITKKATNILTVTEFSKSEIIKYYPCTENKIVVVPNAVNEEFGSSTGKISENLIKYADKEFYFSVGSASQNKNMKYVYSLARKNQDKLFLMSGTQNKVFSDVEIEELNNVIHLGYLSDNELAYMYSKAKGFIFPSFYEGFGIPPLEAIKCGCKCIIVSDIPVMHEVLGDDGINYINPSDYETNIFNNKLVELNNFNNRYSWENRKKKIIETFESLK